MSNDRLRSTKLVQHIPGIRTAAPPIGRLLPVLSILALAALVWLSPADPAQAQDDAGPKVTAGPTITSSPASGETYRAGEVITVTLAYSEAVTVTGKPRLGVMIGEQRRWARYSESGGATLSFAYTVQAADADDDGIRIRKNALRLNGGSIEDADGNAARLKHPALPDQAGHKVNGAPDEPEPEPPANNEPQFTDETAARSVNENAAAGEDVGAAVTAEDADGDALTYALAGAGAGAFDLDAASGQITVKDALDFENKASYTLTVSVHDGKDTAGEADASEDDSIEVTIAVLNVDEPGVVVLDTDAPQAGSALTASLSDPDGGVTGETWGWERSEDGGEWTAIAGATSVAYTPASDDVGKYLRATASYADGQGTGKRATAATAGTVAPESSANNEPQFADDTATRSINENASAGENVGVAVTAEDDDGDALTYALSGADAGAFNLDASTGQIRVKDALDFENKASYTLTVSVHDGKDTTGEADASEDDSIAVTVSVLNVDEPGVVALDTDEPQVGTEVTASLSDPDGGVTGLAWSWERSEDGSEWTAIAGATSAAHTPSNDDAGKYLRATASYADGEGSGKTARAGTAGTVAALPTASNNAPRFTDETGARSVNENAAAGENVGAAVTAEDADGDALTYAIAGADAGAFDLDASSGQITVKGVLDFENKASYTLTVTVHDGKNAVGETDATVDDTIEVTISVLNVDEPGTVALDTDEPQVGTEVTATLSDPDGGVTGATWVWERSADGSQWTAIAGATSAAYTPTRDDGDHYLRATASYADGQGTGKTAWAATSGRVIGAIVDGPPSVTGGPILNSPRSGGVYGAGEEIVVNLTFSEPVTVSGTPRIGVIVGENRRWAKYSESVAGGATLVFSYAVKADDRDDDGIRIRRNALRLNGGSIQDGGGNAARLEHPAWTASSDHQVDGAADGNEPRSQGQSGSATTVVSVKITSTAESGVGTYVMGEAITATVTFSGPVHVTGPPLLELQIGGNARTAVYAGGSGSPSLTFDYFVKADDQDSDGVSIGDNKLTLPSNPVATIKDGSGNDANLSHTGLAGQLWRKVDGSLVWLTELTVDANGSGCIDCDMALKDDDFRFQSRRFRVEEITRNRDRAAEMTLKFNPPQTESDAFREGLGLLTLSIDGAAVALAGAPRRGDHVVLNLSTLNIRGWTRGQKVTLSLADVTVPTVTSVAITSSVPKGQGGRYLNGDTITATVTFSEAVHVAGKPELELQIGADARRAVYAGGRGTSKLTFDYTVGGSDEDNDGISIGANKLTLPSSPAPAAAITDRSNNANLDHSAPVVPTIHKVWGYPQPDPPVAQTVQQFWSLLPAGITDGQSFRLLFITSNFRLPDSGDIGVYNSFVQEAANRHEVLRSFKDQFRAIVSTKAVHARDNTATAPAEAAYAAKEGVPIYSLHGVKIADDYVDFYDGTWDSEDVRLENGGTPRHNSHRIVTGSNNDGTRHGTRYAGAEQIESGFLGNPDSRLRHLGGGSWPKTWNAYYYALSPVMTLAAFWSAALTVDEAGDLHGCDNADTSLANCSSALTDNEFTHGKVTYTIVAFYWDDQADEIVLKLSTSPNAAHGAIRTVFLNEVTLYAGGHALAISASTAGSDRLTWSVNDLNWADGQTVTLAVKAWATVAINSSVPAGQDGYYKVGDTVTATATFPSAVSVTGTPSLAVNIGGQERRAVYARGSDSAVLSFDYTVVNGDEDADGISIDANKIRLNGGTIVQTGSTAVASLSHEALAAQSSHHVDGARPTVAFPTNRDPIVGRDLTISLGDSASGVKEYGVILVDGSTGAATDCDTAAEIASGGGTVSTETTGLARKSFDYAVPAGSVGKKICVYVADAVGNVFSALGATAIMAADATAPTVATVAISSSVPAGQNGHYKNGDTITVTVTFSEKVHVAGKPELELQIGDDARAAMYARGSGSNTLAFDYTVGNSDEDGDGISIGADKLSLPSSPAGTISDGAGNDANRDHSALDAQTGHKVDGVFPTVTGVDVISSPRSGETYFTGEWIHVVITFSEKVWFSGRFPAATLRVGESDKTLGYITTLDAIEATGNAGTKPRMSYQVKSGDTDSNGVSILANLLSGGTIRDAAGNEAIRTFAEVSDLSGHKVDGRPAPTVSSVAITSSPPNGQGGHYKIGDDIEATVIFSKAITVTGTPTLKIKVGLVGKTASCAVHATENTKLVCTYTVAENDADDNGVEIEQNKLAAPAGATIKDAASNDANRDHIALTTQSGHKVDGVKPAAAFPTTGKPAVGSDWTITLSDAGSMVKKYGAIVVDGGTETAAGCDTAAEIAGGLTTETTALATKDFAYTVPDGSAGKKVCVYVEDAAGNGAGVLGAALIVAANAAPTFTSDAAVDAAENQTAVVTVVATDADAGDDITGYAISGGADQAKFSIVAATGVLTFQSAPDFEAPTDAGGNNVYDVTVEATGGAGGRALTTTQNIAVTVTDVNEPPGKPDAPTFGSVTASSLVVNWTAPDNTGPAISDYDVQYRKGTSGEWSDHVHSGTATTATIGSLDPGSAYQARVRATNDEGTGAWSEPGMGSTSAAANAAPVFSSDAAVSVAENQTTVVTVVAMDADTQDSVAYAIKTGGDGDKFNLDAGSGALSFKTAPDYETPTDAGGNNVYDVTVEATGGTGGRAMTTPQDITVTVTNVDEEGTVTFDSDAPAVGTALTATLADPDGGITSLTWTWTRLDAADSSTGTALTGATASGATSAYTPAAADRGKWLKAAASYTDGEGGGKTAEAVTAAAIAMAADTTAPAVSSVAITSSPPNGQGGHYKVGDVITATATFSEAVTVTGKPELELQVGSNARKAVYNTGGGSTMLTFDYAVMENDADDNGVAIGSNKLTLPTSPAATIQDAATNDASRDHAAVAADSSQKVDGVRPTVSSFVVLSPGWKELGATIQYFVEFSESVTTTGAPTLTIQVGANANPTTRTASYDSGSSTYEYTVKAGDMDLDGVAIAENSLTVPSTASIKDAAGNDATVTHAAVVVAEGDEVWVDSAAPAKPANFEATAGDEQVTLTWDNPSDSTIVEYTIRQKAGSASYGNWAKIPNSDEDTVEYVVEGLANGTEYTFKIRAHDGINDSAESDEAKATPAKSGAVTATVWSATLTVDKDGNSYGCNNDRPSQDDCSTATVLTEDEFTYGLADYTVSALYWLDRTQDTLQLELEASPAATDAAIKSALSELTLKAGSNQLPFTGLQTGSVIGWRVTLNWTDDQQVSLSLTTQAVKPVQQTGLTATPGDQRVELAWTDPSGSVAGNAYEYQYRTRPAGGSAWGEWTEAAAATGATRSGSAVSYTATGLANGTEHEFQVRAKNGAGPSDAWSDGAATTPIDTTAPTVSGVAITSSPPAGQGGYYKIGDVTTATVTFSENVTVAGKPELELQIGANARKAVYKAGSGSTMLTFDYEVVEGDADTNGIAIGANKLTLPTSPAATIKDDANRDHSAEAADASDKVDGVKPRAVFPSSGSPRRAGSAITITLADPQAGLKRYGAIVVDGSTGAAADCDTAAEISSGGGTVTTASSILAATGYDYSPPAGSGGKKVCVYVEDAAGNGAGAIDTTAIALTGPSEPGSLSAAANGRFRIDLTWTAPAAGGGRAAVTGYQVQWSATGNAPWAELITVTGASTTSYSHTGLDHSTTRHYRVRATSSAGYGAYSSNTSATTDANSAPVFAPNTAMRSVDENSAAGANVGAVIPAASDSDNDTPTYALGGTDEALFEFNATTRQITVKSGTALDYEASKNSYTVTVTARDSYGGSGAITVAINVDNVDEDGTVSFDSATPAVGTALTATLEDPDGSVSGVSWTWTRLDAADSSNGTTLTGASSSEASSAYTPVAADGGKWLKAAVSYTDGQGGGKSASVVTAAAVAPALPQVGLTAIAITSTPEADGVYRSKATRRMHTYCSGLDSESRRTITSPPCGEDETEVTVATAVIDVDYETIEVTVTFDEAVTVTTGAVADTDVPYLKLDVGGRLVAAGYESGSGTAKLVFRYTIGHRDRDADGVSIPENPIVLLGGASSIRNSHGQDVEMDFAGLGDQSGHKVDGAVPETPVTGGTTPMITKISVESTSAAGTTYGAGEHIDVVVKWSERVNGLDQPYPSLKLTVGANTRTALITSHGGDESRFRYTVLADDATADGFSVSVSVPKDPLTVPDGSFIRSHYNSGIDAVTTYAGLAAAQIGHEVNGSVDNVRPNRPEGLRASGGLSVGAGGAYTHWLDLRWDDKPNRRDGTIIRYEHQLKDGEWTPIPGSGSTTTSIRFTIDRKDYGANPIKVRAVDKGGASEESAAANVSWRDRVPYPAMGLQAAAGANSGEVTLTWNEPADDSTVTRYQYQYRRSPAWHGESYNMPWTTIPGSGSTTTSHTFTGLDGDVQYYFRVRPVNSVGQAPPTDEVGAIPQ